MLADDSADSSRWGVGRQGCRTVRGSRAGQYRSGGSQRRGKNHAGRQDSDISVAQSRHPRGGGLHRCDGDGSTGSGSGGQRVAHRGCQSQHPFRSMGVAVSVSEFGLSPGYRRCAATAGQLGGHPHSAKPFQFGCLLSLGGLSGAIHGVQSGERRFVRGFPRWRGASEASGHQSESRCEHRGLRREHGSAGIEPGHSLSHRDRTVPRGLVDCGAFVSELGHAADLGSQGLDCRARRCAPASERNRALVAWKRVSRSHPVDDGKSGGGLSPAHWAALVQLAQNSLRQQLSELLPHQAWFCRRRTPAHGPKAGDYALYQRSSLGSRYSQLCGQGSQGGVQAGKRGGLYRNLWFQASSIADVSGDPPLAGHHSRNLPSPDA